MSSSHLATDAGLEEWTILEDLLGFLSSSILAHKQVFQVKTAELINNTALLQSSPLAVGLYSFSSLFKACIMGILNEY